MLRERPQADEVARHASLAESLARDSVPMAQPATTTNSADPALDAAAGLAAVSELVEACLDDEVARTRGRVGAFLDDDAKVRAAAAAWLDDQLGARVELAISGLDGRRRPSAQALRKAISEAAVRQEEHDRQRARRRASDGARLGPQLEERLGAPAGLVIPRPYRVTLERGVEIEREKDGEIRSSTLAPAPIVPVGRALDVDTNEEHVDLAYTRGDAVVRRTVGRAQALDARALAELAAAGAPVTSASARHMVPFLEAVEAANLSRLPVRRVTSHMGFQGEEGALGFLAGRDYIGDGDPIGLEVGGGLAARAAGWTAAGTWEGWRAAIVPLLADWPIPTLALYASLCSPMLRILGVRPWILHVHGPTSRGKTTGCSKVAASVWGGPTLDGAGIIGTWDTTVVNVERGLGLGGDLPLFLDDTRRVPRHTPDLPAEIAYLVEAGQGRGRGAIRGVDRILTWSCTVVSTGEGSLTAATEQGGTRARVLEVEGEPFGEESSEGARIARETERALLANHGHAGRRLVAWLIEHRDQWPELRARCTVHTDAYAKAVGGAVAGRLCSYVAAMKVAAEVAEAALGLPAAGCNPFVDALAAAVTGGREADRAREALADLIAWAASQPSRWAGRRPRGGEEADHLEPVGGWLGRWERNGDLQVLVPVLDDWLTQRGHTRGEIVAAWHGRGWLHTAPDRRTFSARIGGTSVRVVAIAAATVADFAEDAADE